MRKLLLVTFTLLNHFNINAQIFKKPVLDGVYLQWGYNRDWYTKSDIHFSNGSKYDFTIHDAVAHDKPDFTAFRTNPIDITIPQNSYRIGFYLNKEHTHAIELNYDHAKYVVDDDQTLYISGQINGRVMDKDTLISRPFVHFEHTNGANFYHINYVGQHWLSTNKRKKYHNTSVIYKLGAGVVVPRSFVILMGKSLDNQFHVAGYIVSAEAGVRYYPFRNFFLEANVKNGFANYLNALGAETGSNINHHFFYAEVIGLIGYDIGFRGKKKMTSQ